MEIFWFVGSEEQHGNNDEIYTNGKRSMLISFTVVLCYQKRRLSFYDLYLLNDRMRTFCYMVEDYGLFRG